MVTPYVNYHKLTQVAKKVLFSLPFSAFSGIPLVFFIIWFLELSQMVTHNVNYHELTEVASKYCSTSTRHRKYVGFHVYKIIFVSTGQIK